MNLSFQSTFCAKSVTSMPSLTRAMTKTRITNSFDSRLISDPLKSSPRRTRPNLGRPFLPVNENAPGQRAQGSHEATPLDPVPRRPVQARRAGQPDPPREHSFDLLHLSAHLQHRLQAAGGLDEGRDPRVGRADHMNPILNRSKASHRQHLVELTAGFKPAVVTYVDGEGGSIPCDLARN